MLNPDQFLRFDTDPDFTAEHAYVRKSDDGSQVAKSYIDTPHGRIRYDIRTSPKSFDVEVMHGNTTIGAMYGPIGTPKDPNTLSIGEISVHSKYTRRGLATQMLRLAQQNMPEGVNIVPGRHLTPDGEKWSKSLENRK